MDGEPPVDLHAEPGIERDAAVDVGDVDRGVDEGHAPESESRVIELAPRDRSRGG